MRHCAGPAIGTSHGSTSAVRNRLSGTLRERLFLKHFGYHRLWLWCPDQSYREGCILLSILVENSKRLRSNPRRAALGGRSGNAASPRLDPR